MVEYKNQSVAELRGKVTDEFERLDKYGYRDDQEIYEAGKRVIGNILKKIKEQHKSWGKSALKELNDLSMEYEKNIKKMKGMRWTTKEQNNALIHKIAQAIDTAEDVVLDKLMINMETLTMKNAEAQQRKQYFKLERNGVMTLLKDVNAPKIHEVLSNLGLQKGKSYEIDYTNCKNPTIKNKMIGLTGTPKVVLQYNGTTYTLRDSGGNVLPNARALLWEGVALKSTSISAAQQKVKNAENRVKALDEKRQDSSIGKLSFSALEADPKWKGIMSLLKEKSPTIYKKLQDGSQAKASEYIHKFLTATENRIDQISRYARKYNYVFMPDSMSKTWGFSSSLLEVHLIARDGSAKVDMNFFDDDKLLGETVYDILDKNENEYMEFVKAWIEDKFNNQYAKYAKTEKINLSMTAEEKEKEKKEKKEKMEFNDYDKEWLLGGLQSLKQTLLNTQQDDGSTWLGDDKKVQQMIYHLENAIATIEDANFPLSKRWFNKKVIDPLHKSWTKSAWTGVGTVSKGFNLLKKGNKTEFIQGIRKLGGTLTNLANTHTTHLANDILLDSDIELKDAEMDKYFKAIKTKLSPDQSGDLSSEKKRLIDRLYIAIDGSAIATILQKEALLPSFNTLSQKDQDALIKACEALKGDLEQQKRALDALPIQVTNDYLASMKGHNEERKSQLVMKGEARTEAESKELQVLYVIEANPHLLADVATNALQETRESLRYFGIDSMVLGTVGPVLIKKTGGLKGDRGNGALYNDIKGLGGLFEWSDENAAFAQQITVMIAEELVFMAVAAALTATTGVGGPALIAARIGALTAKLAKLGLKAFKFKKIAKFMKLPRMSDLAVKFKGIGSSLNKGKDLAKISNAVKIANKGKKAVRTGAKAVKGAKQGLNMTNASLKAKSFNIMKQGFQRLGYKDATSVFKSLDQTIAKGLIHTSVSKTYRGEIDDLNTWITDGLHTTGMYAVLGLVGRVAKAGIIGKSAQMAVEKNTFNITKFLAEELALFGADMAIDLTMGTDPMPTPEDIAQNFALGLGAEILPGIGGSVKKLGNKVKSIHITKNTVTVNGIKYQKEQLANLIAESYENAKHVEVASSPSAIVKNISGEKVNTPLGVLSWADALKMSKEADENKIVLDVKVDEQLKEIGVDFEEVPQTLTDARKKTEKFGYWIGKNIARLDHSFYINALRWLDKLNKIVGHSQLGLAKIYTQLKQSRDRFHATKGEVKKKIVTKEGRTYEGVFYKNGVLKKGKKVGPGGRIEEGQFDQSGVLREGKMSRVDGTIYEGKFDEQGVLVSGFVSNAQGLRYYREGHRKLSTNTDKRAQREKALQDGHLGFHGSNREFDEVTDLKPSPGTSKAFEGVSIARDKEIAIGYALRSLIQQQSGLEFRKGFEVNWNPTTKKYVLSIEGKSRDQVLAMLKNFKQTDFFIYELAKQEDRWGGASNNDFGPFEMATNQTDTEWLTREKISLWDLINKGELEIEGTIHKAMNRENPDYFGKTARVYTTIDRKKAYDNSRFVDDILAGFDQTNQSQKLHTLKTEITKQYQQATGKELHLTETQLLSILGAHQQDGKLGELSLGQLKKKVETLDKTISDPEVKRFLLEAGFCGGMPIANIIDFKKMNSDDILEYAKSKVDEIIDSYKQKYGNIVNADDFRDFVGGDIGVDASKTHQAASYLADTYFERVLKENRGKGNNTIKFLAGGPGSGKSSISSISPNNDYAAVLDGTLKTYINAERNIENALNLGYNVRVEFVFRDVNEAFINGVLKRTISQNQYLKDKEGVFGLGRTVPLDVFEKGHQGARETILKLYDKYGPNVVKIFGGSEENLEIGNGILKKTATKNGIPPFVYEYDKIYIEKLIKGNQFEREKSKLAIEEAYLSGRITEKQKLELLGK